MIPLLKYLASYIFLSIFFTACFKKQPDCSGNCFSLVIAGNMYDKTNGNALVNVPVKVYWLAKGNMLFSSGYNISESRSGSNGIFSVKATIDTTFFKDYYLLIKVQADSAWLCDSTGSDPNAYILSYSKVDEAALRNLSFGFFPKTNLSFNVRHISHDSLLYFTVESTYKHNFSSVDYIIGSGQEVPDTTILVVTAADVFTKVTWRKTTSPGQYTEITDSIKCVKSGNNIFRIEY